MKGTYSKIVQEEYIYIYIYIYIHTGIHLIFSTVKLADDFLMLRCFEDNHSNIIGQI